MKPEEFFAPLSNDRPYLKVGLQGFAGAGKSFTGALIAAGLHRRIKADKPVVIFDTEQAAKSLRRFFRDQGIKVEAKPSRSLADLRESIRICESGFSDILMIDSLTHVWEDCIEAFKRDRRVSRLEFQHWGVLKPIWKQQFSDPFVRSRLHIIMTGRAGYEYEQERDPETGKREIVKSGTKMKVEGETAYEPDILIEMVRMQQLEPERKVWREAIILKDRSTLIDGMVFRQPSYEAFEPAIDYLLGDAVEPVQTKSIDAAQLFGAEKDEYRIRQHRKKVLEEIESVMVAAAPGRTNEERAWKATTLQGAFGSGSWTTVKELPLVRLESGLNIVRQACQARVESSTAAGVTDNT